MLVTTGYRFLLLTLNFCFICHSRRSGAKSRNPEWKDLFGEITSFRVDIISMSKSQIFIFISVSFAAGVLVASLIVFERQWLFIAIGLSAGIIALACRRHEHERTTTNKVVLYGGIFLLCFLFGMLRLYASNHDSQFLEIFNTKQTLEGYIVEDVDVRQNEQLLTFQPKGYDQRLLLTTRLGQHYFYGDLLVASGKIEQAQSFDEFDYQKYLERFNIYGLSRYPSILIIKSHQQSWVTEQLLRIKAAFVKNLSQKFAEPQNSLLLGILIGAKKTLSQDIINNFNATGTSHIIAISGYNITIIISYLAGLVYVLGRRLSSVVSALTIIGFVILTGASASVVRAAIMGILMLVATTIGRQYHILPSLFLAALVMLVQNPKILFWDVGFQLSFAATFGIVVLMPILEQLTQKWDNPLSIKTTLLTTLAATFATMPLILLNFSLLSLIAPVVNILILTLILPYTMLFGFLSTLPWVGTGSAFLANGLLIYILTVTRVFAHIPYASLTIKISAWTFGGLVLLDGILYLILRYFAKHREAKGI